ncbi:MAG: SAM-dependent methyltransferase [Bacteriovorax sp.]
MDQAKRTVYCDDALVWLEKTPVLEGSSLIASMPDISEFHGYTLEAWKDWFTKTAALVLSKTPEMGVTVFYQSDIKVDGAWVDKGYLCQKAAESLGHSLLWHKIICRVKPGMSTFGRPAYTHILCFSRGLRLRDLSKSTPDVMPVAGDKTWERGMGLEACLMIGKFIAEQTESKTLIHPFCGQGSMLAVANSFGLDAIGIERSPKRAELARILSVKEDKFTK